MEIALVTGAAKRIGRDIALRLSSAGYRIAVHFNRSSGEADALIAEIARQGGQAQAIGADLSDWDAASALVDRVCAEIGRPSLLVNCAALFLDDHVGALGRETWRRQFAVNLEAPVLLAEKFAGALGPEHEGAIVNVIDQRVLRLTPQFFSYTLTKSALWAATQTMAQALAPRVRVNAVGPGPTYPNERQEERGLILESRNLPLGRRVEGGQVAEAVLYLARARDVTGQLLCVDGGQHLAWRTPDIVE